MSTNGHGREPGHAAPDAAPLIASPFPPIGEYGFLSDCETTALVAPSGNVEWLCLPRIDSPSVFGSILDRDAGGFRFGPSDIQVPGGTALPAGHDDPRDELGLAGRLDHRAGRDAAGPLATRERALEDPAPAADRLRHQPRPAAHGPLRERRDAAHPGLRAGVRLRTAPRHLALHRGRLSPGRVRRRGERRRARPLDRHEPGVRGPARHGAHPHQGGRDTLLRAGLERRRGTAHDR